MRTIVLILRGCPAGWLGPYGNEWVVTPHLDRLASESVVFDRHISDYPDAAGACRAWMGGNPGLFGQLRIRGIPTILVRANHPDTDAPDWFYAAWSEVFDARPEDDDNSPLDSLLRTLPGLLDRLVNQTTFLLWIEIDRLLPPWEISRDVFDAYLRHEMTEEESPGADENGAEETEPPGDRRNEDGTHSDTEEAIEPFRDPPTGPFDASDPDALTWLSTSFGSVVTTLDSELGSLFGVLRERGFDQSATWIMTSDFGYPLGEHGQLGVHRPWLHEELVHLPLITRLPGGREAGRRVQAFTQPPDVAAAILRLFDCEAGQGGLLGLARGEVEILRTHAISTLDLGIAAESAVRTNEWAYLLPRRIPEGEVRESLLFQKPEDRWEVNDLRARHIGVADELESILKDR